MSRRTALGTLLLTLAILLALLLLIGRGEGEQAAREALPSLDRQSHAPAAPPVPGAPSPQPTEMRRTRYLESGVVTLRVIDALSGDALTQATVEVNGGYATPAGATEPGVFHVHREERGVLRARAAHAGHLPAESFLLREFETLALHPIRDLVIAVRRYGTGEPVEGADVDLLDANGFTLWHGRTWTSAGVASCPGHLFFQLAAELPRVHAAKRELGRAEVALSSEMLANGRVTLYLVPTIDLGVEILSSQGVPVPGATVRQVVDARSWRLGRPSRTDTNGRCLLAVSPADAAHRGYMLLAESEGFASRLASGYIPANHTVRIRLGQAAEPCGVRLLDAQGVPLMGVAVHLTPSSRLAVPGISTSLTAKTQSGAEGIALFDVPDGENVHYELTVPGHAGRPSVAARYSRASLASIPTVQLPEGVVRRVRVTDRHGAGVGGAELYVVPRHERSESDRRYESCAALLPAWTQVAGKTDRDGNATLTLLGGRAYACLCWAPGFAPAAQDLTPDAGIVMVPLERLSHLTVNVTDTHGRGMAGIAVKSEVATQIGAERVFLPPALRQRIQQLAYTAPDGTTSLLAGRGQSVAPVRPELGSPVRVGDAHLRAGRVDLRIHPRQQAVLWVADENDNPFPGVLVSPRVDGMSQGLNDAGVTDTDGRVVVGVPTAPADAMVQITFSGRGLGSKRITMIDLLRGYTLVVAARREGRSVSVRIRSDASGDVDSYPYRIEQRSSQAVISGGVAAPGESVVLELPDHREYDLVIGGDHGPPVRVALPEDDDEALLLTLPAMRSITLINRCQTWEQIGVWEMGTTNRWTSRPLAPGAEEVFRLPDEDRRFLVSAQRVMGKASREHVRIERAASRIVVFPDYFEVR